MEKRTLTFGAKLGIATGILGVVIVLLAAVGMQSLGKMEDTLGRTVEINAHKLNLAGRLNAEEANMAVGQRGLIMFSYARNAAGAATAEALFQESSAQFQRHLGEIRPLVVTGRGKELIADIDRRIAEWLPAYAELNRLAKSGDPDGATRVLSERITAHYLGIGSDAAELAKICEELMQQDYRASAGNLSATRWLMLALIAVGAFAGVFAVLMMRSTATELRRVAVEMLDGSRQVATAADQVASASQSLAQGTSEQAA